MRGFVVVALALGVAGCGNMDRGSDSGRAAAAATASAPPLSANAPASASATTAAPGTDASAPNSNAAVTRGGIAVQQPVSPMMRQAPTGTDTQSISTPRGTIGTTGAF
jgi:hypothetical protein